MKPLLVNTKSSLSKIWSCCLADVILDPLLSLRKDLKGMKYFRILVLILDPSALFESSISFLFVGSLIAEQHNVKVSVNDIVIKAVAVALRNVPEANGNDI